MKTLLAVLVVVGSLVFASEANAGGWHRSRVVYYGYRGHYYGYPAYYAAPTAVYVTPRVVPYYSRVVVARPAYVLAPRVVTYGYRPAYSPVYPVARSYYCGW